jgi:hypothetical protein
MTTPYESPRPATGWVGWIAFAAVFMIVSGVFGAIEGLAGIFRDDKFFTTQGGLQLSFSFTTWGWINLILGIVLVLVGIALIKGATWAQFAALVVVSLHLVSQFWYFSVYPLWALIVILVDILILYAIIVHGDEMKSAA